MERVFEEGGLVSSRAIVVIMGSPIDVVAALKSSPLPAAHIVIAAAVSSACL